MIIHQTRVQPHITVKCIKQNIANWNPLKWKMFFSPVILSVEEDRPFWYVGQCMCRKQQHCQREHRCQQTDITDVGLQIILEDLTVNQHRWPECWGPTREGHRGQGERKTLRKTHQKHNRLLESPPQPTPENLGLNWVLFDRQKSLKSLPGTACLYEHALNSQSTSSCSVFRLWFCAFGRQSIEESKMML